MINAVDQNRSNLIDPTLNPKPKVPISPKPKVGQVGPIYSLGAVVDCGGSSMLTAGCAAAAASARALACASHYGLLDLKGTLIYP